MNEIIKIEGLRKRFGDNEVLKGITTSVSKGEVVAIIGPSGCGKSTFLRSINLLEEPTEGKIFIDDMDITSSDVDINRMRQRVGMVFQQFNLFPNMTIRRNIMLAPVELGKMTREEADEKATELLTRIGLLDKADSYPDSLSGGVRHEDDVSAGDEVGAHLVHILYGGRVKTESEAAQSWHSHAVALGGPCCNHFAYGRPSGVDHCLRQSAAHGGFFYHLRGVELAVEFSLHHECPLLLTFFERYVALNCFYFNTHNSNRFFNG